MQKTVSQTISIEDRLSALEKAARISQPEIDYESLLYKFIRWHVITTGEQVAFWWNLPASDSEGQQWFGKWSDEEIEKIKELEKHYSVMRRKLMEGGS